MNNLIKSERYKLFHNPVFWILLAGMTLLGATSGSGYTKYFLAHTHDRISITSFSGVFNAMVADSTLLLVAVCAMLGWFMGREFSLRVISTEVASGHSRTDIFISKTIVNLCAYNIVMILYCLAGAISQIGHFGTGNLSDNVLNILRTVFYMILLQSAFFLITITIAFILRNGIKTAVVAPIVSFSIAMIFVFAVQKGWSASITYLNPIYRLREVTSMGSAIGGNGIILFPAIITGILWIAACSIIILKSFTKSDLK